MLAVLLLFMSFSVNGVRNILHQYKKAQFSVMHTSRNFITPRQPTLSPATDISLNDDEISLINVFKSVVENQALNTTVRIAGGWVRDKLLGKQVKEDIDIALDNMSGEEFARALNRWYETNGQSTVKIAVIKLNPEKSKHLETATVKLGKFEVDLVNLRTETYSNDSRVPDIEFGTPLQDALRRDLTINSLFYNVNSGSLEDFTGRGIADLSRKLIHTPLPSLITLQDDPLRALRAIRFACRLEFEISDELCEACRHPSVTQRLLTKVSQERTTQEVEQMLRHGGGVRALIFLNDLSLMNVLFAYPPKDLATAAYAQSTERSQLSQMHINYQHFNQYGFTNVLTSSLIEKIILKVNPNTIDKRSHEETAISTDFSLAKLYSSRPLFERLFTEIDQTGEKAKIFRISAVTSIALGVSILKKAGDEKCLATVNEYLLMLSKIGGLRMKRSDVQRISTLQESSRMFLSIIEEVSASVKDEANMQSSNVFHHSGPVQAQRQLNRLSVSLAIRKGGDMYKYAIWLACTDFLTQSTIGRVCKLLTSPSKPSSNEVSVSVCKAYPL